MSKNDDLVRQLRERAKAKHIPGDLAEMLFLKAADAIERGAAQGWRLLNDVRMFIEREYADPLAAPDGEWLAKEARPIHDRLCTALANYGATPPAPAPGAISYAVTVLESIRNLCGQNHTDEMLNKVSALGIDAAIIKLKQCLPAAPAPDAGEAKPKCLGIAHIDPSKTSLATVQPWPVNSPTPQPPADEAVAERFAQYRENMIGTPAGTWVRFIDLEAALKAKTDEIERLRQQLDEARSLHNHQVRRAEAAEASNKALREERNLVLKAVLYHFGPDGANKVTTTVIEERDS